VKKQTHNRFKKHPTPDLALLYVAINTSHLWKNEDGFPRTLKVLMNDPEKEMLRLSKEIETELTKRGIHYENLC